MNIEEGTFAADVRRQLTADGYTVHVGDSADGPELSGKHWFTWMKPGMSDAEVGPTCDAEPAAWSSALAHRLENSAIELHLTEGGVSNPPMGPFFPARLPDAAFDVDAMAERFGVTREATAAQIERLRRKAPVHDWRHLQAVKNLIIGPEHEGFEVYPAEARLVDTANQYHLWVFLDPKVRLPVGFGEREVLEAHQAAAVGATQRDFQRA